jgi:adenosine deaminase
MVSVNSDDPANFGGYINENYLAVTEALGCARLTWFNSLKIP